MGLIASLDFVSLSGSIPLDTVTNTTLSGSIVGATPEKIEPLPLMSQRPGFRFPRTDIQKYFNYPAGTADRLRFSVNYGTPNRRSFVLWYYCHATTQDAPNNNYIWASGAAGFALMSTGLRFNVAGTPLVTAASGNVIGWHCAIMAIDRAAVQTTCYLDKVNYGSFASIPTTDSNPAVVGHATTDREHDTSLGHIEIYDYILNQTEVDNIYNSFLVDTYITTPFVSLSGVVFDNNQVRLSGAKVLIYDHIADRIVSSDTTTVSGNYLAKFSHAGEYSLFTTKSGTLGGRAFPVTVTSGRNIIVYDN